MGVVSVMRGRTSVQVSPDKPAVSGLVAHAGGGKASALPLSNRWELISIGTVASAGDSILLPPAFAGHLLGVSNDGANSMQVFGAGTDTINNVATATGVAQASGVGAVYFCAIKGNWTRVQSS